MCLKGLRKMRKKFPHPQSCKLYCSLCETKNLEHICEIHNRCNPFHVEFYLLITPPFMGVHNLDITALDDTPPIIWISKEKLGAVLLLTNIIKNQTYSHQKWLWFLSEKFHSIERITFDTHHFLEQLLWNQQCHCRPRNCCSTQGSSSATLPSTVCWFLLVHNRLDSCPAVCMHVTVYMLIF